MTVTFVATSLADAAGYDPVQCYTDATAGRIAPYCREGIGIDYTNSSGGNDTPDLVFTFPKMLEGWISFYTYCGDMITHNFAHFLWALRNFSDNSGAMIAAVLKLQNSLTYHTYRATGGANNTFVALTGVSATLQRWDVRFKVGVSTGELDIYVDGSLIHSETGVAIYAESAADGIDGISFQREGGTSDINRVISGLIVSTTDTRSMVLAMDYPSGAGTHSEWMGSYADVDGTGTDTTTSAYSDTAGERLSLAFPALDSGLSALTPVGVAVKASGPAAQMGILATARISSTDYTLGVISTPNVKPALGCPVQTVNPATGLTWTQAEINAAEFGLESTE